ncbi:MAG: DMT family transporter [Rhodobacteraceae bacterium]|nr:DMT family transporter [Paracoccaceae bacterium]
MSTPPTPKPIVAILLVLVASALIGAVMVLAKALGQGVGGAAMHPFQIVAGRYGFAFLALMLVRLIWRQKLAAPAYQIHAARIFFGWLGMVLLFIAVTHIPVVDATAISFLGPVAAMVLAVLLLGEKTDRKRWLAAAITVLGALILLRPGSGAFQLAEMLAVGSAVAIGFEMVILRYISAREAPFQILVVNSTVGVFFAGSMASFIWIWPSQQQWLMMAGIGLSMLAAQALFIAAMRRADFSVALPFAYSTLIFATGYDMAWFGTRPDLISIIGAVVILLGVVFLAWREGLARRAALPIAVPDPKT